MICSEISPRDLNFFKPGPPHRGAGEETAQQFHYYVDVPAQFQNTALNAPERALDDTHEVAQSQRAVHQPTLLGRKVEDPADTAVFQDQQIFIPKDFDIFQCREEISRRIFFMDHFSSLDSQPESGFFTKVHA